MQVAMGLGVCMVAPIYVWELSRGVRMTDHWENYAGIVYMAVFPSFISYLFFNRGVHLIGGARAGQSMHLIPVFGSIMAVVFLGETLRFYHLAGVILIGSGLALSHVKRRGAVLALPVDNELSVGAAPGQTAAAPAQDTTLDRDAARDIVAGRDLAMTARRR
jgi:drug/metabolite transporter (DMT)-like permease